MGVASSHPIQPQHPSRQVSKCCPAPSPQVLPSPGSYCPLGLLPCLPGESGLVQPVRPRLTASPRPRMPRTNVLRESHTPASSSHRLLSAQSSSVAGLEVVSALGSPRVSPATQKENCRWPGSHLSPSASGIRASGEAAHSQSTPPALA